MKDTKIKIFTFLCLFIVAIASIITYLHLDKGESEKRNLASDTHRTKIEDLRKVAKVNQADRLHKERNESKKEGEENQQNLPSTPDTQPKSTVASEIEPIWKKPQPTRTHPTSQLQIPITKEIMSLNQTMGRIKPIRGNLLSPSDVMNNNKDKESRLDKEEAKPSIPSLVQAQEALFVIKDKVVQGLSEDGKKKAKDEKQIRIPEGIEEVGEQAFANLQLEFIYLPNTLKRIKQDAFYNNKLTKVELPTSLEYIERGAFDANHLDELVLTNPKCTIDGVFYNDKYVNILSANPSIKDETYKETKINYLRADLGDRLPFGSLINRGDVQVNYYDDQEKLEFSYKLVSKNRNNRFIRNEDELDDYFKLGEKVNVVALKNDYLHLANVRTVAGQGSKVDFYYHASSTEEPEPVYEIKPQINGTKQPLLLSTKDVNVDLKKDVFATDGQMKDISEQIEVLNANEIQFGTEGVYKIKYRVTDDKGKAVEAERLLYIEEEKKWYPHDFYYDQNILLGLSQIGEWKLNRFLVSPSDKKIDLPKVSDTNVKLDTIASAAFAKMRIREINIPNGYEVVRKHAFDSCLLEHLILPDSIKEVQDRAFAFTNLKTLTLSKNLVKVGERSFANTDIHEILLPESLEYIGEGAFINSSKLQKTELTLPSSVKYIGLSAFENCKLSRVVLNEGLVEIADAAFAKNNLTEVHLPATLQILSPGAFKQNGMAVGTNYHQVKLYTTDGKNPKNFASNVFQVINPKPETEDLSQAFTEEDFTLTPEKALRLSEKGKKRIKVNKELIIPDTIKGEKVEKIADLAFVAKKLTKLILPSSLKEIGGSAFEKNDIVELVIPSAVRVIKNGAFFGNSKLKQLTLPQHLEKIEKNAFLNSGLERVQLPEQIQSIEQNAFKKKSGKVRLVIQYNTQTATFIEANRNRKDFILEVLGEPQNDVKAILQNKITNKGVKEGDVIVFALEGFSQTAELKINDTPTKFLFMDKQAKISYSRYKNLIGADKSLRFEFSSPQGRVTKEIRLFKPEVLKLLDPNQKHPRENTISFTLALSQYPYEGIVVYETPYSTKPMQAVAVRDNHITLHLDTKPTQASMKFYIEGDYHTKSEILIQFQEEQKSTVQFRTIDSSNDTVHYKSTAIDQETYNKLKESFEAQSISMKAGRTEYTQGSDKDSLYGDDFYIDFDDEQKTIDLYINTPSPWEQLEIKFADVTWNYYFDNKDITEE